MESAAISRPALAEVAIPADGVDPLAPEAYWEAAQVLGRAFWDDPLSLALFVGCGNEERVRRLTKVFYAMLVTGARRRLPVCVRLNGRITGVGIIYPPRSYPYSVREQLALSLRSIGANGFGAFTRGARWTLDLERWHPKVEHYYLEALGVEPGFQGQGIGSAIVRHMTALADRDGVGCYLESSKARNVLLYERHGFATEREIAPLGVVHWLMWRAAH